MAAIETVLVERKDHPDGWVRINKDKLKAGDVVYGEQKKTVSPAPSRAKVSRSKSK